MQSSKELKQDCLENHNLSWTKQETNETVNGSYVCQICQVYGYCSQFRWYCEQCKRNICSLCKPKVVELQCTNHHQLFWCETAIGDYEDEEQYVCNGCQVQADCNEGRNWCSICQFDLCLRCSQGKKYGFAIHKTCNYGHELRWSIQKGVNAADFYSEGKFPCSVCEEVFSCDLGRHQCYQCRYDVCQSCVKQTCERANNLVKTDVLCYQCKICDEHGVNIYLKPCGHVVCAQCCANLESCPFDRRHIDDKLQIQFVI